MAPILQHQRLSTSSSSPNFYMQNCMNDLVSNSNKNRINRQCSVNWNLNLMTSLTSNSPERRRLEMLAPTHVVDLADSKGKLIFDNMKFRGRFNVDEQDSSTESLFIQQTHGVDNYHRVPFKYQGNTIAMKTELVVVGKLDYEYKREQKCLMELKDKITEVEEEYNEIVSKQKEKEKRLKERVQKLKKRFQVVVKFHSYLARSINHSPAETPLPVQN